ncbi:MAG: FHA domain-containing protein [Fibrobacterota bacterium]|nr:FHA domain-containing protein [Fibrobacterota bacterium]
MPLIEVVSSPANLQTNRFPLREGPNVLGRDKGCDIEIPDPRISSKHCIIMVTGENVEFIDQNSTNGIYIDDQRLRKGKWAVGATVFMGNTEMRLKGGPSIDLGVKTGTSQWGHKETAPGGGGPAINNANFDFNIVQEKKIGVESQGDDARPGLENFSKRMQVINRMIKSVTATLTIPDLLDRTMTLLFEVLNCDTGYIIITDPVNQDAINAHVAYERGKRKENLEDKLYSRTLVSTVIQKKSGFIFDSDESGEQDQSLSIFQLRIKSALCCPIHSEGQIFGVIYLDNKKRGAKFNGDDLDLTMNIAGIAGVAIENMQLYKKLETETLIRDHLKRFCSPNIAEKIIAERGSSDFHLQSQKTTVTVLFADIRGFTPLSETLAPLEVAQLLNNYFSEMCAIVFANGGTLDKFIGDCMMVLFNAPVHVSDHEFMAVKTALQMKIRLRQMLPKWQAAGIPEFQVGIGVNTGEAVVGSIGTTSRMEYTAIGDTVNISSRVCGIAKPNQILITEAVWEKVKDRFRTVAIGATQLKGKSRQVLVHEVVDDLGK